MEQFLLDQQPVIESIAEDISLESFSNGIEVDYKYAEYYVKSILMTPDLLSVVDGKIIQTNREKVLTMGIDFFSKCSPDLCCLKLQALFASDYKHDDNIIKEHNNLLFTYLEPLMQFIVKYKVLANDKKNHEILFRKIILLVGLLTGMGNPSKQPEFEEVEAAVISIISPNELEPFGRLPAETKREQLIKLSQIVAGIRLHNKHKLRGGAEIVDLPKLVDESAKATMMRFERFRKYYKEKVEILTSSLEDYYGWDYDIPDLFVSGYDKGPYDEQNLKIVKSVILLLRQMLIFIGKFCRKTCKINTERKEVEKQMTLCLSETEMIIDLRSVVPVQVIYPIFYRMSLYWNRFQNMVTLLSFYNRMIKSMDKIVKECISQLNEVIVQNMNEEDYECPDEDSKSESHKVVIDPVNIESVCLVVFPDEKQCFDVKLEYNGFCPVYCKESEGALFEADRMVGIIKYENKYFGFKDFQAARAFGSDPEGYISVMLDFARKNFLYMDILKLRNALLGISIGWFFMTVEDKFGINEGTQTETHFYHENIDKNYKSNIWEWKKDLCHWATLYYYRTHSTQTNISLFKSSLPVQTVASKEVSVQTLPENYTQTPIPSTYFYGLRGRTYYPESHLITLTRPVEEPPFDTSD